MKMNDLSSRFLRWAFGDQRGRVMVVSFKGVPRDVPGYSWHAERADVLAKGGAGLWPPAVENNNYFCVSLFRGSRRQDVDFESLWVLGIDDVGTGPGCKVDGGVLLDRLGAPGWVIETSPGNQQWFYRFREGVVDEGLARLLVLMVRRSGDTTASQDGKLLTRLMRLPSGTNGKEDYLPDGYPTAVVFSPEVGDEDVGTLDDPAGVLASWDAAEVACGGVATADLAAARRAAGSGLAGLGKRVGKSVLDLIGDDPVGKKLLELGFVRGLTPSGLGVEVVCPWEDEHTVKSGTGAAYFPEKGGFECHHGHCQGRTYKELVGWLEEYLDQSGLWEGGVFGGLFSPVGSGSGGGDAGDGDADGGDDDPPLFREVLLAQYVFVENEGAYLDLKSGELIAVAVLNDVRREEMQSWLGYTVKAAGGKETVKFMTVHGWFLKNKGRVATRMMYWPGAKVFFSDDDGVPVVNRYRPAPRPLLGKGVVTEGDVGPYVGLIRDLCANEGPEAAEWVLDLLALIVGEPGVKPGFGLLLQSEVQGLGKDLILVPVIHAVGEDNCAQPSLGEVTEKFNPWAARRLVVVSDPERNTRGTPTMRDFYATIKPYTQNVSTTIDIRDLGRKYRARNVSAWVITANPDNALPVDATDRRFLVVMSIMPRKSDQWYADHVQWQNANLDQIGEFFHQRCESMPAGRRALLLGHAPPTPGKAVMAQLGEDHLKAWMREQIENGHWPDLMTSEDIRNRMVDAGRRGEISRPLPSETRAGSVLKSLGGGKVYGGNQLVVGRRRTRLWATTNTRQFDGWGVKDLNDAYQTYNTLFDPV